jgi:hypothetical protein
VVTRYYFVDSFALSPKPKDKMWVRFQILKDSMAPRKVVPLAGNVVYQQGDLIVRKVKEIPANARPVKVEKLSEGGASLGGGYFIRPADKE